MRTHASARNTWASSYLHGVPGASLALAGELNESMVLKVSDDSEMSLNVKSAWSMFSGIGERDARRFDLCTAWVCPWSGADVSAPTTI